MPKPSSPDFLPHDRCRRLQRALLLWFRNHARALPWRADRDPYAIWVSEVMLQQTQVATVARYFSPFMHRFPDIPALARAKEQTVLKFWEGLGYYRRARDLWKAARLLARVHSGRIPDDPVVLRELPGFGQYTTNAVLSQAYGRRVPVVEANSRRVLCRLFGIEDAKRNGTQTRLWELAEKLLPPSNVGDFNQAMMELGALVCTPRQPQCGACPLAGSCRARQLDRQESIPSSPTGRSIIEQEEIAIVCRRADRVLVVQRPDHGRWAKMWEFPHGPREKMESPAQAGRRLLTELTALEADIGEPVASLRHGVTRFRIHLTCLEARHRRGTFRSNFYRQGRWLQTERLSSLPFSSPQRKLAACLRP